MDFDKIKRVAKDTFKVVSGRADEPKAPNRPSQRPDDFDDFTLDDDLLGETRKFDMKDALNRVKKNTEAIKNSVSDIISNDKKDTAEAPKASDTECMSDIGKVSAGLVEIGNEVEALRESTENLENHIVIIERKLSEIANSVSGVNKINDSIFDLKNSQINTRNSINEMELSLKRMRKKMISGLTVISIITAVIAILEVINLLS